jgi:hypothetical protein
MENDAERRAVRLNKELPDGEKRKINTILLEIWTGEEIDDELAGELGLILPR